MAGNSNNLPGGQSTTDLGPLTLCVSDGSWLFTLSDPQEMLLELPSDYEDLLVERLGKLRKEAEPPPLVMDLENIPGSAVANSA